MMGRWDSGNAPEAMRVFMLSVTHPDCAHRKQRSVIMTSCRGLTRVVKIRHQCRPSSTGDVSLGPSVGLLRSTHAPRSSVTRPRIRIEHHNLTQSHGQAALVRVRLWFHLSQGCAIEMPRVSPSPLQAPPEHAWVSTSQFAYVYYASLREPNNSLLLKVTPNTGPGNPG